MKPSLLFAAVTMCIGALVIQGTSSGDGSYEGLLKDVLGTAEHITQLLKTVKDRPSAEVARPELKKAALKMLDLRKKAEESKQPSKDQREKLKKEFAPKFDTVVKQINELSKIVKELPGGDEAVSELLILKDKNDKEKEKDKKDGK